MSVSSSTGNGSTGTARPASAREPDFDKFEGTRRLVTALDAVRAPFLEPGGGLRVTQLEVAFGHQVGGSGATDRDEVDGQAVESKTPDGAEQADRHDRVPCIWWNGDPLRDPDPAPARHLGPGSEPAAAGGPELVAQKVDHEAGILAQSLAGLDMLQSDPEADDHRLVDLRPSTPKARLSRAGRPGLSFSNRRK